MRFEEGQRYVNGLGRQLTIVAVDDVPAGDGGTVEVLAYQYDGSNIIHLRAVSKAEGWVKP